MTEGDNATMWFPKSGKPYLVPAILCGLIFVDLIFPPQGVIEHVQEGYGFQVRLCIGLIGTWDSREGSYSQRVYLLVPYSLLEFRAVGVESSSTDGVSYYETSRLNFLIFLIFWVGFFLATAFG